MPPQIYSTPHLAPRDSLLLRFFSYPFLRFHLHNPHNSRADFSSKKLLKHDYMNHVSVILS